MFCKHCGKQINDNQSFCPFCGTAVTVKPSADLQNYSNQVVQSQPQKPKKNKKKVIIAIVAVILAIAIGVGGWFLWDVIAEKKKGDSDSKERLEELLKESTTKPIVEFVYDDYDSDGTYEAYAVVGETDEEDEKHPEFYDADIYFVNHKKAQSIKENISGKVNGTMDVKNLKYISIEVYDDGTDEGKSFIYTADGTKSAEADISGEYSNVHEEDGRIVGYDENGNLVEVEISGENKKGTSSKPELLEATDEDFENFELMLEEAWLPYVDFDRSSTPLSDVVGYFMVCGGMPVGLYTYYFDEVVAFDEEDATYSDWLGSDPDGKFGAGAIKMEADKVDWIVENVFGLEPDNSLNADLCYYKDGYVYVPGELGGGPAVGYCIINKEELPDGRYEITAMEYNAEDIGYLYPSFQTFVCELKYDDTMGRYWSFVNTYMGVDKNPDAPGYDLASINMYNAYSALLGEVRSEYSDEDYLDLDYLLYDLNNDDVLEIIIKHGTCEADYTYYVYTMENNRAVFVGETSAFHSGLGLLDGKVVESMSHMGYVSISEWVFDGTTLSVNEIESGDYEDVVVDFDTYLELTDANSTVLMAEEVFDMDIEFLTW